ncbi:MAG: cbb3-type cytochrome c oxidase subunit I, partial [Moraxellaceae bacterium]|nr:cbb3-type cytochrome c oxidase subunit I [Moraxellaceae bacterium]
VHDTYFIVAHLHYVLIGGVLFPVFAALYYWMPVVHGHPLSERAGRWVFGLMFGGFHLAFFPMHISGLLGMPRRIYTYADGLGWNTLNLLSTMGAFVLAAGVLVFVVDLIRICVRPRQEHDNPWGAPTLEWLPMDSYSTRSIPEVGSRYPLWDQEGLAGQVDRGEHWLPGTVTGFRETLVITPLTTRPHHLAILPGDSWLPFLAAFGTAGFFLLLTIKAVVASAACGVLAVGCIVAWLWQSDRGISRPTAEIGERVQVPIGARGRWSHSWWGVVLLLVVDATIFAAIAFSHVHVSMLTTVCPPPGAALPATRAVWLACALFAGSSLAWWLGGYGRTRRMLPHWHVLPVVLAACLAVAGCWVLIDAHQLAGLSPRRDAWSATVAAMLSYLGLHGVLAILIGSYMCVRIWQGLCGPRSTASYDNSSLLWHFGSVLGVVMATLPFVVTWWMD